MVFHSSLGLPSYFAGLFLMATAVCLFFFWRALSRRAETDSSAVPLYSDTLNRWIIPLIAIGFVGGFAAFILELFRL